MSTLMKDYVNVDWSQANCHATDLESFYRSDPGTKTVNKLLHRICSNCPIMQECGDYAVKHERHGYWGGMTALQRRSVRNAKGMVLDEASY